MPKSQTAFLKPEEVAAGLRVSRDTVYRAIASGHLRAVRLNERGSLRVLEAALGDQRRLETRLRLAMRQPGELVTIGRAALELDLTEFGVRYAISQGDLRPVPVQRYGTPEQRLRIPESELDRWIRCRWVGDPSEHWRANVDRARARVRAFKREAHQAVLAAKRDVRRREAAERAEALAGARRQERSSADCPSRLVAALVRERDHYLNPGARRPGRCR
jgi:excisionase family DNA binding protein